MAITIIYGKPRIGKTCLMTHLAREVAFDSQRTKAMQSELAKKWQSGFKTLKTVPPHCVSGNYPMRLTKPFYSPRVNRIINPYRLGFVNDFVETHFTFPYEFICITEAQKYFNSRKSKEYPDWQSRYYEQHGHNHLDFLLDTQRPGLIDVNIRALSDFMEVMSLDIHYDRYERIVRMKWRVRRIEDCETWEKYMSSGKRDKSCYDEDVIVADYNVFNCYDSRSCKPKFYAGHFDEDIDYDPAHATEESLDGYLEYLKDNDDELPDGFYQTCKKR